MMRVCFEIDLRRGMIPKGPFVLQTMHTLGLLLISAGLEGLGVGIQLGKGEFWYGTRRFSVGMIKITREHTGIDQYSQVVDGGSGS